MTTSGRCRARIGLLRLVDVELHPVELAQEVVGELDVGLVDLVDQHHRRRRRLERLPQHAALDVVGDVADMLVAQLRIAQPRHRVVFVESLLGLGRRLDVPLQQRPRQRTRDLLGEHRLAGAGLALDEQRPLERDRRVDGEHQVGGGDVGVGAFEAHGKSSGSKGMMLAENRRRRIAGARRGNDAEHFGPVTQRQLSAIPSPSTPLPMQQPERKHACRQRLRRAVRDVCDGGRQDRSKHLRLRPRGGAERRDRRSAAGSTR